MSVAMKIFIFVCCVLIFFWAWIFRWMYVLRYNASVNKMYTKFPFLRELIIRHKISWNTAKFIDSLAEKISKEWSEPNYTQSGSEYDYYYQRWYVVDESNCLQEVPLGCTVREYLSGKWKFVVYMDGHHSPEWERTAYHITIYLR